VDEARSIRPDGRDGDVLLHVVRSVAIRRRDRDPVAPFGSRLVTSRAPTTPSVHPCPPACLQAVPLRSSRRCVPMVRSILPRGIACSITTRLTTPTQSSSVARRANRRRSPMMNYASLCRQRSASSADECASSLARVSAAPRLR
jgi:hypothetical protein